MTLDNVNHPKSSSSIGTLHITLSEMIKVKWLKNISLTYSHMPSFAPKIQERADTTHQIDLQKQGTIEYNFQICLTVKDQCGQGKITVI